MDLQIVRLDATGAADMGALNALFAEAFDGDRAYTQAPPDAEYLARTLARADVIALVAKESGSVIGGLVAYVLPKLEQARSEIYIYDLAVRADRRRQGVARRLIAEVQAIAAEMGAWVVYVQADHGDDPAIALYSALGTREEVLHFDLPPKARA